MTKKELVDQVQNLYETDLGDFKRKLALYFNRFLEIQTDSGVQKKMQKLKQFMLYNETISKKQMENIDHLRMSLLEQLKDL